MNYIKLFDSFILESYLINLPKGIKSNLLKFCEVLQSYVEQNKKIVEGQVLCLLEIPIDNNLKKIIPPESANNYYDFPKKENLDNLAKELSKERGVEIIFNKDLSAFTTKSGGAFVRIIVDDKSEGAHVLSQFKPNMRDGFCYERGALLFDKFGENLYKNKSLKQGQLMVLPPDNSIRFRFADFTNNFIYINVNFILDELTNRSNVKLFQNTNRGKIYKKFDYKEIFFEVLEHEMTHIYDPNHYLQPPAEDYKTSRYAGSNIEFPTLVNQLLSKLERIFIERIREDRYLSDSDRSLKLEKLIDLWEFFTGKKSDLDENTYGSFSGGLLSLPQKALFKVLPKMKTENPDNYKIFLEILLAKIKEIVEHYNKLTEYQKKLIDQKKQGWAFSTKLEPITIGKTTVRDPRRGFIRQVGL